MQTTNKSINEQIKDIHSLMDNDFQSSTSLEEKLNSLHHHNKVIIQHIMKLEAKAYYINKKLDEVLGLRPRPQTDPY